MCRSHAMIPLTRPPFRLESDRKWAFGAWRPSPSKQRGVSRANRPHHGGVSRDASRPFQLRIHQRIGVRRPPGQIVRPGVRRHRRRLPCRQPAGALRHRDAGDDQPHCHRRRVSRRRRRHAGAHEELARATVRDIGYEQGRVRLEEAHHRELRPPPVRRHRARRRRAGQQGRRRGRPGHHVRLRLPRDARAHAGADPLLAPHPSGAIAG